MRKTRSFRSQAVKIISIFVLAVALICFVAVAVGGVFPTSEAGTSIVVPQAGETWHVGELHTVQWTLGAVRTVNDKGENITAKLVLSYGGTSKSSTPLGELTDWFNITDTLANVIVPSVPTRQDYTLYMYSRDDTDISSWSGSITISNPNDVDGQDDPPTSIVVTTAPPISVTRSLASTSPQNQPTTHSAALPPASTTGSLTLDLSLSLSLPLLSAASTPSLSTTTTAAISPASATISASQSTSTSTTPLSPTTAATTAPVAAEPTTAPATTQTSTVLPGNAASTAPARMKRARTSLRHAQRHAH